MKTASLSFAAIALLAVSATSADAQCAFDTGLASTSFASSMVRSYAACPSTETPVANTNTRGGRQACSPVLPLESAGDSTVYRFAGNNSGCKVTINAYKRTNCATNYSSWFGGANLGLPTGPCQATRVRLACRGIVEGDGITPINTIDQGFSLSLLLQLSVNDQAGGDMTALDVPISVVLPIAPLPGRLTLNTSLQALLVPIPGFGTSGAALPTCTTIRLVEVRIADPFGLPFAEVGVSTR